MAEEIELKLLMQPQDLPLLDKLMQDLGAQQPQVRWLENTYLDTPSLDLNQHRAALRLRNTGQGWVQTLKTSGASRGALSRRGEWEVALQKPELDPQQLPEGVLEPEWLAQLQPIFTTHFTRKAWQLQTQLKGQALAVELAADQGEVALLNGKKDELCELELELQQGEPEALFTLAQHFADKISLHLGLASKAERALRLLDAGQVDALVCPQLGEQTQLDALLELANYQLNRWISCHERWAFNAEERELQEAQRALLSLQGLLVVAQRLCPQAPLHAARVEIKKLLAAFAPLVVASHADRVLQSLQLPTATASSWRLNHLGYAERRRQYRSLWKQVWVGQAEIKLLQGLYLSFSLAEPFPSEAPKRLLAAACAHLRLPLQPMDVAGWLQRYPALIRLQMLLQQAAPEATKDLRLANQLVAGIEDLQGYQVWLSQDALPQAIEQQLLRLRQDLLFNLGRWSQTLWTAA